MPKTKDNLTETKGFEPFIEDHLLANGYIQANENDYDFDLSLNKINTLAFLHATQPEKMAKLHELYGANYEHKILNRIASELNTRGVIDVLRKPVKDRGVHLELAYFKPVSALNPETVDLYKKNIFTVRRQVHFCIDKEDTVDILISVNGFPIALLELKNPITGQKVSHAIRQFQKRRPEHPLFAKRCVVFFAVDTDEVYMSTKLASKKTYFLPFNKGFQNGSGNPPTAGKYKTAYLWEDVLEKDSLLEILQKFMFIEKTEKVDTKSKVWHFESTIFPRYHQLDAVRKILQNCIIQESGTDYLIQHSAGSGKTKTISWLAHRLASLYTATNQLIYDSVIVITDRRVLDKQLQDSIYQLEHKHGVVARINKDSTQLTKEIEKGTKIIITTLQKFPFVLEKLSSYKSNKYAIIIDEAHSSTSGEHMKSLKEVLSVKSLEEAENQDEKSEGEYDSQDEINNYLEKVGPQSNLSFFAFTATPKAKTMEMFGTKDSHGKPLPFHLYSMKQAIEEGFILDVLENYVTYETYFKIGKCIQDDPEYDKKKATRALARFVSLHPYNIAQKTEIIIDHFYHVTRHKIGGKAKAMLVTSSRMHAVRYKLAFDVYIDQKGYSEIKTLVAFSGTVKDNDTGLDYNEKDMNHFKESELPSKFDSDQYNVLIVAEKFQTGFDQPLLHTMYIDKKLSGVKAVQTISRLNRISKGKDDTFVLDFVNKANDIQESFKPYFETTILEETTDPNILYDIESSLGSYRIWDQHEIDGFVELYMKPKNLRKTSDGAKMNAFIDPGVIRYSQLEEEKQEVFKSKASRFNRLYSFILQITLFKDVELHKLFIYLRFLMKKIPKAPLGAKLDLYDEISLDFYKNKKIFDGNLSLADKNTDSSLTPVKFAGTSKKKEEHESLSSIIERLNLRFGTKFTPSDQLSIEQIKEDIASNEELVKKAKANSIEDFELAYTKVFDNIVIDRLEQNQTFFTKILNEDDFKTALMKLMLVETYNKLKVSS